MLRTLNAAGFSRHLLRIGGQLLAEQATGTGAPLQAAFPPNINAGTGILSRFVVTRSMASMAKKLHEGKVAIVTASTDGIGYAIAKRLAEDGASVVVSSRKKDNVEKAVAQLSGAGLDVCGTVCHVGKDEDRKNLVKFALEKKGGVDIFVSNAAVNPFMGPFLETPEDAWDKIFDINVKSAFLLTKEIVPHMEKRGGGSIVFVSSIGGYQPFRAIAAYSVSKTTLLGLTKALAQECVPMKIRVNCICPGVIQTKFSKALWEEQGVRDQVEDTIPLHRIGKPDECAGLVSFLCSSDASYITGESVAIAGGLYSRL